MAPDILLIGQVTVDDTVPASPGLWERQLGGNACYSVAGARLWCDPDKIGVVARVAEDLPFDLFAIFEQAGLSTLGLSKVPQEALVEWIMYEEDGNRQSLPRNLLLRDPSADLSTLYQRYLTHIESLSASFEDIPAEWLPAKGVHLAPQVLARHLESSLALADRTQFLSIDPSPHYSRGVDPRGLRDILPRATAFLPSQAEIEHLGKSEPDWCLVAKSLQRAGFPEVVLKRGSAGCILVTRDGNNARVLPIADASPRDLTGAGDAFSGAYAATRALGFSPEESAERALVAAAMIVECSGTESAFQLKPQDAERRLKSYRDRKSKG